jgi:hypothetical protein
MNITPSNPAAVPQPQRPAAESKTFTHNAQDPKVQSNDTITLSVSSDNGALSTDAVKLDNKKAIFVFGQLVGLRPDPSYKLTPNADGNFVYPEGHALKTGAIAFSAAANTVEKYNQVSEQLTGQRIDWAFDAPQLTISPETGEWPNAFYARQFGGVHFFDHKAISTGDSGEVAAHEVGHAVLDGIRPGYLSGTGAETGAFHEAFGDNLAMLMTLQNEQSINAIVAQTGGTGDLSSGPNMLADMGEGFGKELGLGDRGIRTMLNTFTYKDPATLPERGDENNLGHEVHDFARLWAGAFYDVVDGISDANRAAGMSPQQALKAAGEESFKLLVGQMAKSPNTSETTFKEMATHLVAADAAFNGGARQDVIKEVLVRRELLSPEAAESIFKSEAPTFTGNVVKKAHTFGSDAGALAGVKFTTQTDQPAFGFAPMANNVAHEAEKGAKLMLANDQILFTDKTPELGELFKADGTTYKAYVAPNAKGEPELQRVPIVFEDHGHGHGHEGHIH